MTLCVHLKSLGRVIYDERSIDLPRLTSAATPTARIPLKALASGWHGPLCELRHFEGFEVRRLADLDPLLDNVLAEIERNLPPSPDPSRPAMTALIGRIRARETVRRADAAKQGQGFWRRLFPRG